MAWNIQSEEILISPILFHHGLVWRGGEEPLKAISNTVEDLPRAPYGAMCHVPEISYSLSHSLSHSLSLSLSLSLSKCSSSLLLLSLFDVIVVQRHSSQNLHQNAMTRERSKTAISIRLPFHSCHQQSRMTFFSYQHEAFLTGNQMAPTPGENVWL